MDDVGNLIAAAEAAEQPGESNSDVKLALEEMRFNLKQSLRSGYEIDKKAQSLAFWIVASGALMIALQHPLSTSPLLWLWLADLHCVLFCLMPKAYKLPLQSNWDVLDERIFNETERDAILTMLSGYVTQNAVNIKINKQKAIYYRVSSLVFLFLLAIGSATNIW